MTPKTDHRDHEAERRLVWFAVFYGAEAAEGLGLRAEHFDAPEHRERWAAVERLIDAGEAVDTNAVARKVGAGDRQKEARTVAALAAGGHDTLLRDGAKTEADRLRKLARLRMQEQALADAREALDAEDAERVAAVLARGAELPEDPKESPLRPLARWGWMDREPPPREWLLEGVLPRGKAGMLAAAGGVGKTMLLTQLAVAVAAGGGIEWLGMRVRWSGPVLLCLGEEDEEDAHRRIRDAAALLGLNGKQRGDVERHLYPYPLAGQMVGLTEEDPATREARESAWGRRLWRKVARLSDRWALVVFDPLSRFSGPDAEKDNAQATRFVQAVERFAQLPGRPTVLVAHHTTKAARSSGSGAATAARGASALTDGFRWQANLRPFTSPNGEEHPYLLRFAVTKSNYAKRPEPLTLARAEGTGMPRPATADEHREAAAWLKKGEEAKKEAARSGALDGLPR